MRWKLLALAFALAPIPAQAIDLPVQVKDGAAWTQTSVHTRSDTRNGVTQAMTATSVIRTTYRSEGGVGVLRQEFVSFDVAGVQGEPAKQLAAQARLIYPVTIEVDEALAPARVRDWNQMRDRIFEAIATQVTDPRAVEAVKASYDRMSDAQAATLFKEQAMVSLGQGLGLEAGETRRYDSEVPNPLGGPPIRASGEYRLEAVDTVKHRAVLLWSQTPDPGSLAASIKATMDAMLARIPADKVEAARAQLSGLTIERHEHCRFEIDVPTGFATAVDCTVDLKSGAHGQMVQRSERWTITQILPEPR